MKSFARLCVVLPALCLVAFTIGCGSSSTSMTASAPAQAAPVISSLSPSSVTAGSADTMLTVSGNNFAAGSEITWGGAKRETLYISSTSLQTELLAPDLATAATVQVAVANPADEGGAVSDNLPFLISAGTKPNPVPVLTSITPSSIVAGSPDTTIALTGANFIAGSQVTLSGGVSLASTYQSSTALSAVIPAASLVTAGSLSVSVSNPSPGGGTSSLVSFTVTTPATNGQSVISLNANDLAWDPVNQVIYLSLPSTEGSNGNSIQVLNPSTGALGKNVFAGSEPDLLSVSESSQYLYAALDGSSAIQRFKLPDLTTDINISLGAASFYGPYVAMDLQASPTTDGTFAVVRGTPGTSPEEEGGVLIFDNSVQRPNQLCGFIEIDCTGSGGGLYDSIQWGPAADAMYMLNNEDTGFDFYTVPVTSSGFGTVTDYGNLAGGFGDRIHYDATTKLLYSDYGVVINPATGTKAGSIDASGLAAPDGTAGLIFYLGQTRSNVGSSTFTIESFDINHLTPIGTLEIKNVAGTPIQLIRWGSNGLAFVTYPEFGSSGSGAVYLISGSFVTTAERTAGSVPSAVHHSSQFPDRSAREPKVSDGTHD